MRTMKVGNTTQSIIHDIFYNLLLMTSMSECKGGGPRNDADMRVERGGFGGPDGGNDAEMRVERASQKARVFLRVIAKLEP
jgi:hypothetical protein